MAAFFGAAFFVAAFFGAAFFVAGFFDAAFFVAGFFDAAFFVAGFFGAAFFVGAFFDAAFFVAAFFDAAFFVAAFWETMASCALLDSLNLTTVFAGIFISSPVAGLRPKRALRSERTNRPMPGMMQMPTRFVSSITK